MNRGYTIVELIVVITVLGLLITLAAVGASTMLDRGRNAEARSKLATIKSGLEKYYAKNNEYPSAQSLAGGGDGRNLSNAQYQTIATTLEVPLDVLKGGQYKFVPCVVSNSPCTVTANDNRSIIYLTRMASDVSSATARTYIMPSSGCSYTFPAPATPNDAGYTSFYLAYRDPSNSDSWTQWNVVQSNQGPLTRGAWCAIAQF